MKTTNEILATWDAEGFFTDWYAIDSYNPITHEETRLFVGELDDVVTMMTNYYDQPAMVIGAKFYRSSIISSVDALSYFRGLVPEPISTDELVKKCVEIVTRRYELYREFLKEGNDEMKDEFFTAYWHTLLMASELTGKSTAEITELVWQDKKC